jgi:hypothetical protein
MNPVLVLKVLDLAMLGFAAFERYQSLQTEGDATLNTIERIRRQVLLGEIDQAEAMKQIEGLTDAISVRRRAAFAALPQPTFGDDQDGI